MVIGQNPMIDGCQFMMSSDPPTSLKASICSSLHIVFSSRVRSCFFFQEFVRVSQPYFPSMSDVTDPVGDVMSFIHNFEQRYGPIHPTFYQGTYSQVIRALSYLLFTYMKNVLNDPKEPVAVNERMNHAKFLIRNYLTNIVHYQVLSDDFMKWVGDVHPFFRPSVC